MKRFTGALVVLSLSLGAFTGCKSEPEAKTEAKTEEKTEEKTVEEKTEEAKTEEKTGPQPTRVD